MRLNQTRPSGRYVKASSEEEITIDVSSALHI